MKKLILPAVILVATALNAQTEKGNWMLSGATTIGFNNAKTEFEFAGLNADGPEVSSFTITPTVGYFVSDNLAVGLDLTYSSLKTEEQDEGSTYSTKVSTLSLLPSVRYFFKNQSAVLPYLGGGIGYGNANYENSFDGSTDSYDYGGLSWKLNGGLVWLISKNVGLDLGLSYGQFSGDINDLEADVTVTQKTLGATAGITVFLPHKKTQNSQNNN